jgi:hypothetical protein
MYIRLLALFVVCVIGFEACNKTNDPPPVVNLADSLVVVNASADTVNIYKNGTRLNNNSNLYPGGSTLYYYVASGDQSYQVKKPFNPATSTVQTLFSIPLTLRPHNYYSLFIAGETSDKAFQVIDSLQKDTVAAGKCYVRFINATPSTGNLDLTIGGQKFSNQVFKAQANFTQIDTGTLVPVVIYQSGSATPVVSETYTLQEARAYTFYSMMQKNAQGVSVVNIGTTINL